MATIYISSDGQWVEQITAALRYAQDGDKIQVDTEAKAELGRRAMTRLGIKVSVEFVVKK